MTIWGDSIEGRRDVLMHLCYPGFPAEMFSLYQHNFSSDEKPTSTPDARNAESLNSSPPLLCLSDNLIHSLGKVVDIMRVQASHADPSILRHVDVGSIS